MVQVILYSPKGNQGVRYFPYTGYLGLTPVKVEGIVRTKVDRDGKLLQAKSIAVSVRCYESRIGRVGTLNSNILVEYSQILWAKPDDREYGDLGELEFPFRITLPPDVAGHSTATFPDFRTYWRVEAVIHHIPITGVGSRNIKHFDLPLIRFDLPRYSLSSSASSHLDLQTTKPRAPRIRYSINTPTFPIGPLDLVSIPLRLSPSESNVSIRSASVIVERRIQLNDTSAPPSPYPSGPVPIPSESNSRSSSRSGSIAPCSPVSTSFYNSSSIAIDSLQSLSFPDAPSVSSGETVKPLIRRSSTPPPHQPHSPTSDTPSKIVTTSVAGAESSGCFAQDTDGVWSKTLTLQWPATKSSSRWTIGETIQSELVTVRFFVKVKIIVSSPAGTESIELAERELIIVQTNDAQRQLAVSNYNEQLYSSSMDNVTQTQSKSPYKSKIKPLSSPINVTTGHDMPTRTGHLRPHKSASASSPPASVFPVGKPRSVRRPHTSAGPRDKSYDIGDGYTRPHLHDSEDDVDSLFHKRLPESETTAKVTAGNGSRQSKDAGTIGQKRLASTATSRDHGNVGKDLKGKGKGREVMEVRAWEEELERIESESRRSTASMFGFSFKRKRIIDRAYRVRPVVGQGAS